MEIYDIGELLNNSTLTDDNSTKNEYDETEDAWIIYSNDKAYKIYKTKTDQEEHYDLTKRREHIMKELSLNDGLSRDLYQKVVPVRRAESTTEAEENSGEIIDYALVMKKIDQDKILTNMLKNNTIKDFQIMEIAYEIAAFHSRAEIIKNVQSITQLQNEFARTGNLTRFVVDMLGKKYGNVIHQSILNSQNYLENQRYFIQERTISGFVRDVHGNLHSGNIIIDEQPIILGRVDHNGDQRKIDVLRDIALVGMEIEFYGHPEFSNLFYSSYMKNYGSQDVERKFLLYKYFKLFHCNSRVFKLLNKLKKATNSEQDALINDIKLHIDLMNLYNSDFIR